MKKMLYCLMFIFTTTCAFAHTASLNKKFYVGPENIFVKEHEILVEIDGHCFSAAFIAVDENGVYAIRSGVQMAICPICDAPFDLDNQSSKCPHPWTIRN